jgi:2-haloacid dehalogenase
MAFRPILPKSLAPEILSLAPEEILFISSNAWDVAGAKAFGYKVCWCNRSQGYVEQMGFPADFTTLRLDQITDCSERK